MPLALDACGKCDAMCAQTFASRKYAAVCTRIVCKQTINTVMSNCYEYIFIYYCKTNYNKDMRVLPTLDD